MENWDEVRTAYQVAQQGTVSGAAAALGVHHATVIRHIDALESRLGVKLFQRHARGYTPTEAGADLARVAQATDDQLAQLGARIRGRGAEVSGELVITSLANFSPRLIPVVAAFQLAHPGISVRFLTGQRLFRLEYGEAHVAIRAGRAPEEPDNVAQKFVDLDMALYAAPAYVARRGLPEPASLQEHDFVGPENARSRAPFMLWMTQHIPSERVIFKAADDHSLSEAIRAGIGLGFLPVDEAEGLIQVAPPQPEWRVQLWLVTHVDLHRTAKVQAFLAYLKDAAKTWCQV